MAEHRPPSSCAPWELAAVAAAVLVGAAVRLTPALASDFPLGDGGLFLRIVEQVHAAAWPLPRAVDYNGGVPFVYPPLAFYLGAALAAAGLAPLDVLRLLPGVLSLAAIVPLWWLARRLLGDASAAAWTAFAYAAVPSAWEWRVAGGGLTRSAGQLALLAALVALLRLWERPGWGRAAGAGLAAAVAVLCHPEAAVFLAGAALVIQIGRARSLTAARWSAAAAGFAAIAVAPWAVTVLARHGVAPWQAALSAAYFPFHPAELLAWSVTSEAGPGLWRVLALLGAVLALTGRCWEPAAFMAVARLGMPRAWQVWGAPAVAMLAGVAAAAVVRLARERGGARAAGTFAGAALALVGAWAGLSHRSEALRPLPAADRAAIARLDRLPAGTRVLVVEDPLSTVQEWLPALSHTQSVTTYQGAEWTPGELRRRIAARIALDRAAAESAAAVAACARSLGAGTVLVTESWTARRGAGMIADLAAVPGWRVVWTEGGAAIVQIL